MSGILVDKRRIERVVANLVENAAQYAGGATRLAVEPAKDAIRLVVADHGPGVPPSERERVFERFYRGQSAGQRGATNGTGSRARPRRRARASPRREGLGGGRYGSREPLHRRAAAARATITEDDGTAGDPRWPGSMPDGPARNGSSPVRRTGIDEPDKRCSNMANTRAEPRRPSTSTAGHRRAGAPARQVAAEHDSRGGGRSRRGRCRSGDGAVARGIRSSHRLVPSGDQPERRPVRAAQPVGSPDVRHHRRGPQAQSRKPGAPLVHRPERPPRSLWQRRQLRRSSSNRC